MNAKTAVAVLMVMTAAMMPRRAAAQMDPNANNPGAIQAPGPGMQGSGEIERSPGMITANNPRATNQPTSMRDSLGAPGQNGQQILDKQFMRSAAAGSLGDIRLSTLATEKGSPAVKDLAQRMVDDHTAMNKELESVADAMGVMLPKKPGRDEQAEYDKLKSLSGKDFDTEYVTYLAKAHWQDVHNFRMEASVAVDPDLQAEVMKALGMMREHIGMINKTAGAEGIALPQRPPRVKTASTTAPAH